MMMQIIFSFMRLCMHIVKDPVVNTETEHWNSTQYICSYSSFQRN